MKTERAVRYLKDNLDTENIAAAFVLGSGLSFIEDRMEDLRQVRTSDIPDYPVSTVQGHRGTVSTGFYAGKKLMVMAGRVHYYEGYTYGQVVFPTELIAGLGVKALVQTNASGGINMEFGPGTAIALDGYIAPFSPVYKNPVEKPFSERLNAMLEKAGEKAGVKIRRGIYAYMTGPSFETKAEIEYLRLCGADAVGMSTVPETVRAKELGLETVCISRVANFAAGITGEPLSHQEVLAAAGSSAEGFVRLLKEFASLL